MNRYALQLLVLSVFLCPPHLRAEPPEYVHEIAQLQKSVGKWDLLLYLIKVNTEKAPAEDSAMRLRLAQRTIYLWQAGDSDRPLSLIEQVVPGDTFAWFAETAFQSHQDTLFHESPPARVLESLPDETVLALLRSSALGELKKNEGRFLKNERLAKLNRQAQLDAAIAIVRHGTDYGPLPYPLAGPVSLLTFGGYPMTFVAGGLALHLATSYPDLFARLETITLPLATLSAWGIADFIERAHRLSQRVRAAALTRRAARLCERVHVEN